jgi:acetylornithine deacetylase
MNDRIDAPGAHISTTELLARLVSFDTTSRNSNVKLIEFVSHYLDGFGVPYRISRNAAGDKANLHAIIGPQVAGGIALSGHVDVVPVDGQAWSTDPFTLHSKDGRLFGRGATDMKGFVACALAAVPDLLARNLARPVHLFVTHDEETDMSGARRMVADLAESGLRPDLCVVGEPSSMEPILGHKGRLALRVTARGHTGHSSMPGKGVNAVHALGEAIAYIAAEQRRFAAEGPFDPRFDPPHTTPHIGTVQGGTILNIIPELATFTMEWRTVPANDFFAEVERLRAHVAAHIEPAMRAIDPATGFTIEVMDWVPGLALSADHALATLTKQLAGSNSAGYVSYATEGGLYENAGIPTIVCGPGSIEQAHKADEWIAESQLAACDAFIRRLADRLAA